MPLFNRNKRKPTKERKPFISDEEWEKEEEEDDEIEAMEMMDDDWLSVVHQRLPQLP